MPLVSETLETSAYKRNPRPMPRAETPVTFQPFFGGFILETLTIGMYGESRNAIREYIQNGFDSIRRAQSDELLAPNDGLIRIHLDRDSKTLTIRDNGTGIAARQAVRILTQIGASTKDHRRSAGFRGIGRLAGIVFSDTVTFETKAQGERTITTVVFDAKKMRKEMAPTRASRQSATDLIADTVSAHATTTRRIEAHYLEVRLEGLKNAPPECHSITAMIDFVSQIAPVPYAAEFPFTDRLDEAARQADIAIEQIRISVREGRKKAISITKPYGKSHRVGTKTATIDNCDIVNSPSGNWWGWVGKKSLSGAFSDTRVAGIRVRVRNIQIDATNPVREVFLLSAVSHARFQDYFIGEIFVRPGVLVPNARRDDFEEDPAWRKFRRELLPIAKALKDEAYQISKQGQLSVDALKASVADVKKKFAPLRRSNFANVDRAIAFSKSITTVQRRVAKALVDSTVEVAGQLNVLGSELADIKRETLSSLGASGATLDREKLEQEARDEMLEEIIALLEDNLTPTCFTEAREILLQEYGPSS